MSDDYDPDKDSPIALIDKMIELKIFEVPDEFQRYNLDTMKFTKDFEASFRKTLKRLASDPQNRDLNLMEGLRSMLLNYVGNKITDEHLLLRMIMMVFSLIPLDNDKSDDT